LNGLDIAILALLAICAIAGYRKGLILTVYRLVSLFLAIFLAIQLYPHVAGFLRETPLFPNISSRISSSMNLGERFDNHSSNIETELIDTLPLPNAMRNMLHANNTPSMRNILRVDSVEDYVSGFFANIVINAIALLIVFVIVLIGLAVVGIALDLVSKLPVINTFNKIGGLAFGLVMGAVISWLVIIVMTLFFATGVQSQYLLEGSLIASWIFNNEWVLPWLTDV